MSLHLHRFMHLTILLSPTVGNWETWNGGGLFNSWNGGAEHPVAHHDDISCTFSLVSYSGVRPSQLGMLATYYPIVPTLDDIWVWTIWRNENWQENWCTWRKPVPVSLFPPWISHDLSWDQTQTALLGSWQLTKLWNFSFS